MIKKKAKLIFLIAFTFIGSYITLFIIFPYAYWVAYFKMPTYDLTIDVIINFIFCLVLIHVSLYIDRRLNKKISWAESPFKRLFTQTLLQVLGAISLILLISVIYLLLDNPLDVSNTNVGVREAFYAIISIVAWALMISALNTGDFLLKNWRRATLKAADFEIKAAQNKQLAAEIELQALKLQLDPHFVFNNLSVLSELILKDQHLGYEYTENFTKVYRYLLINSKKKLISLREELKFLNAYLFLIKNRMGDGAIFHINVAPTQLDLLLPPITLQLFIENALKYNRTEIENPLKVNIYTNENDELVVSNTLLPLIKKPHSTGIGLKNIIDRYALLSEKQPSILQNEETFTVKVPLIK